MSLNSLLMYGAMRTYPEIRSAVLQLLTKYNKANELNLSKARQIAEYIYGCQEEHTLILVPKSLNLMSAAAASYSQMEKSFWWCGRNLNQILVASLHMYLVHNQWWPNLLERLN
jgi:hypothetical protein